MRTVLIQQQQQESLCVCVRIMKREVVEIGGTQW